MSKKIAESSNTSRILGVLPYVDPKSFNNNEQKYQLNNKSDVYSIGVLMWEISSGHQPFYAEEWDVSLALKIINGRREDIIDETPVAYSNLYQGK